MKNTVGQKEKNIKPRSKQNPVNDPSTIKIALETKT